MPMPRFIWTPFTANLALKSTRTTAEKAYRIINIGTTRDLPAAATASAARPSMFRITAAELTSQIHYDAFTASLSGRTLRPDPDPPRRVPLS